MSVFPAGCMNQSEVSALPTGCVNLSEVSALPTGCMNKSEVSVFPAGCMNKSEVSVFPAGCMNKSEVSVFPAGCVRAFKYTESVLYPVSLSTEKRKQSRNSVYFRLQTTFCFKMLLLSGRTVCNQGSITLT